MAIQDKNGLFADRTAAGGLFRPHTFPGGSGVADTVVYPGPMDVLSRRDVCVYYTDFQTIEDLNDWANDEIDGGTNISIGMEPAEPNGVMRFTGAGTTESEGIVQFQFSNAANAGAFVTPAANRIITFETCIRGSVLTNNDWTAGLHQVDTTTLGANGTFGSVAADDGGAFWHRQSLGLPGRVDASYNGAAATRTRALLGRPGTSATLIAGSDRSENRIPLDLLVADTWYKLGIRIEGTSNIEFYIDDRLVHAGVASAAMTGVLTPSIAWLKHDAAATFDVDYITVSQTR